MPIKNAFVYVDDTTGLVSFINQLIEKNVKVFSYGKTFKYLKRNHVTNIFQVSDILTEDEYNRFAELNRLPDLTRLIQQEDAAHLDLIILNNKDIEKQINIPNYELYDAQLELLQSNDITNYLRLAACCYDNTIAVCQSSDYDDLIRDINLNKINNDKCRIKYSQKTFAHLAKYNSIVSQYLFPNTI